jgi:menaquinone-dependent protoporphyrinogen oxidase
MGPARVLVAFASQNGSTAGIAEAIVTELRQAGFAADCRPAASITDLTPYGAVVLGSGVFLARRPTDGGGFIARHADDLARRAVWLYSAGPIGAPDAIPEGEPVEFDTPVARVARAIGALGSAAFGTARLQVAANDGGVPVGDWGDLARVRQWAASIAAELPAAGIARATDRSMTGQNGGSHHAAVTG